MNRQWVIRARRGKSTIYVFAYENDSLRTLHGSIATALNADKKNLGLTVKNELVVPPLDYASIGWDSTLTEVGLSHQSDIFYVLRRADGGFEEPNFVTPVHPPPPNL